mmetsp:Transcript_41517/g.64824  ORF Transcript_41517/g.64824 Transcript_41517/m.64824 type:complete len:263 (-) Transcript_41517:813-1601(-)
MWDGKSKEHIYTSNRRQDRKSASFIISLTISSLSKLSERMTVSFFLSSATTLCSRGASVAGFWFLPPWFDIWSTNAHRSVNAWRSTRTVLSISLKSCATAVFSTSMAAMDSCSAPRVLAALAMLLASNRMVSRNSGLSVGFFGASMVHFSILSSDVPEFAENCSNTWRSSCSLPSTSPRAISKSKGSVLVGNAAMSACLLSRYLLASSIAMAFIASSAATLRNQIARLHVGTSKSVASIPLAASSKCSARVAGDTSAFVRLW